MRLLVVIAVLLLTAPAAHAQQAKPTLPDVEDEVMCISCGTVLNVSQAPSADREREFIRRRIAEGMTKQQIKDALVVEYGRNVLATPPGTGKDALSWLIPVLLAAIALLTVGLTARRWKRTDAQPLELDPLDDEDAKRLEKDLARYDL